jgi:Na+-transporting NADH:ubiquinone oxidoreductase subunit NqrF
LIYSSLVVSARGRCPKLKVWFLAEQDVDGTDCILGRINAEVVFGSLPEPLALIYYLAGPPEMIAVLQSGLKQCGVTPDHLIADAWE